jgi:hypothetical protein
MSISHPLTHRPDSIGGSVLWVVFAHTNPGHLRELVGQLVEHSPACRVVVHLSMTGELTPEELPDLAGPQVSFAEPRYAIRWGDTSLFRAIRLVLEAVVQDAEQQWVGVVAGDVAPVRPLEELSEFLASIPDDGVVAHRHIPPPSFASVPTEEQKRYYYRYRPIIRRREVSESQNALLRLVGLGLALLPGVSFRRMRRGSTHRIGVRQLRPFFDDQHRCYRGGPFAFFRTSTLRRTFRQHPVDGPMQRHYERTVLPEESGLVSMMKTDPNVRLLDRDLVAGIWEAFSAHPTPVTQREAARLLAGSGAFLCRKASFDAEL